MRKGRVEEGKGRGRKGLRKERVEEGKGRGREGGEVRMEFDQVLLINIYFKLSFLFSPGNK